MLSIILAVALSAAPKAPGKTQLKIEVKPPSSVVYVDGQRKGTGSKTLVMSVTPGSPAAKAGMRAGERIRYGYREYGRNGDILTGFDGKEVTSVQELAAQIDHHKAGEKVTFTVMRGNQKLDLAITLEDTPREAR